MQRDMLAGRGLVVTFALKATRCLISLNRDRASAESRQFLATACAKTWSDAANAACHHVTDKTLANIHKQGL